MTNFIRRLYKYGSWLVGQLWQTRNFSTVHIAMNVAAPTNEQERDLLDRFETELETLWKSHGEQLQQEAQ